MRHFEGRAAVVTGAGLGTGLGLARTFARLGMSVVLCDIRDDCERWNAERSGRDPPQRA